MLNSWCSSIFGILLILVSACSEEKSDQAKDSKASKYSASLFEINTLSNNTYRIELISPWDNSVKTIYCSSDSATVERIEDTSNASVLQIPVRNWVSSSATHIGFLDALQSIPLIQGHAQPEYIQNAQFQYRLDAGEIIGLTSLEGNQVEQLVQMQPDLVLVSSFAKTSEAIQRIQDLGIEVLPIAEWKEQHPLGRLDWLRLFGVLTNQYDLAKRIVEERKQQYLELVSTAIPTKTKVLSGYDYKGIWHCPGGKSFLGILFQQAGLDYPYQDNSTTGSISSSIEEILLYHSDANVWLFPGTYQSIPEIIKDQPLLQSIEAVKTASVYQVNVSDNSGNLLLNDYWEKGVVHPEWILSDCIQLAQSKSPSSLYFFTKLPKK